MIKYFYLTQRWDSNRYYHSVNLGVMAKKGYFTFPKASKQEPHHQMLFSVITRTRCLFKRTIYLRKFCNFSSLDGSVNNRKWINKKEKGAVEYTSAEG